jgi:hypothetical protein
VENQAKLYGYFDHVMLLSAPLQTLLERVTARTANPQRTRAEDREEIAGYLDTVEPLLRRGATLELDGRADPGSLVAAVELLL